MDRIFATTDSWNGFILRMGLGIVMFMHGTQKMLGWFGGAGFDATMAGFTIEMQIPKVVAVLIIMAEFFGGLGLILGVCARVAAFGILCVMLGAVATVHWNNGFFMSWTSKQAGQGIEFHLLAISIAVAVMVYGAGRWSIDRTLEHPRNRILRERASDECAVQPPSHL